MKDIKWLDGKDAVGKYILEIVYQSGGLGYLKNDDHEGLLHYCKLLSGCPEVVDMIIYSPNGKVVSQHAKAAA